MKLLTIRNDEECDVWWERVVDAKNLNRISNTKLKIL